MTDERTRFQNWWWIGVVIIFLSIFLRFWRLDQPKGYYFDEVYHAVTAKLIHRNDPRAYEWWNPAPEPNTAVDWLHPPFAKLTQGLSMRLWGENEFGWRFSSAVVGTLALFFCWRVARLFTPSENTALLAVTLLALDGLALSMSRIAMNDMHVTAAILFSVWMYWRWKERPTVNRAIVVGLSAGLAVGTKWSGVFLLPLFFFDQMMSTLWALLHTKVVAWRPKLILILAVAWLVPAMYLLSYQQMFFQGKDWKHFHELHQQIWWYQTNLDATHPYQSTPLEWVLNLRPVYAYTHSSATLLQDIYLQSNPLLLWFGCVAVFWLLADTVFIAWQYAQTAVKALRATPSQPQVQAITQSIEATGTSWFLLAAYGVFWLPWLFSPRILFFYHYLPSIPFLCIILTRQLEVLPSLGKWGNVIRMLTIGSIAIAFFLFLPHWLGWEMPREPWQSLYFALESWR